MLSRDLTFYGTFGQTHYYKGTPMKNFYVEVKADTLDEAKLKMHDRYGNWWATCYDEKTFQPSWFPNGRFETIT